MSSPNVIAANADAGLSTPDTPGVNGVVAAWGAFTDLAGDYSFNYGRDIQSYADAMAALAGTSYINH